VKQRRFRSMMMFTRVRLILMSR